MRKRMNTIDAMKVVNVSRGVNDTLLDKVDEIIKRATLDVDNNEGKKLDNMNAVIYGRTLKIDNTIVAYYDGVNVIEFGKYSGTTLKQVSKFAKTKGVDIIRINDFYKFLTLYDEGFKFKIY